MNTKKRKLADLKPTYEQEDDQTNNLYYIYENKKQKLYSSLKIANRTSTASFNSFEFYSLRPTQNGSIRLFDMCLTFIATNLESVESLIGFPSQIGELLFKECIRCKKFYSSQSNIQNLLMFANAYPNELVESLNASTWSVEYLSCFIPVISICQIKYLDLSNLNLADMEKNFNENLIDLIRSSAATLTYLNLSNNNLDEKFIQKLTLPQRLNTTNFAQLKTIDLSRNNRIRHSDGSGVFINYFNKFQSLNEIVLDVFYIDELCNSLRKSDFKICHCKRKREKSEEEERQHMEANKISNIGWISNIVFEDLFRGSINKKLNLSAKDFLKEIRCVSVNKTKSAKNFNSKHNFYCKASNEFNEEANNISTKEETNYASIGTTTNNNNNNHPHENNYKIYIKKTCQCFLNKTNNNSKISNLKPKSNKLFLEGEQDLLKSSCVLASVSNVENIKKVEENEKEVADTIIAAAAITTNDTSSLFESTIQLSHNYNKNLIINNENKIKSQRIKVESSTLTTKKHSSIQNLILEKNSLLQYYI